MGPGVASLTLNFVRESPITLRVLSSPRSLSQPTALDGCLLQASRAAISASPSQREYVSDVDFSPASSIPALSNPRAIPSHLSTKTSPKAYLRDLQVVPCLKIHPKPLRGAEVLRQTKSGIRRDRPRTVHDLVDPPCRNTNILGQAILAKVHRNKELCQQDLTRMYGRIFLSRHLKSLPGRRPHWTRQIGHSDAAHRWPSR